MGSNAGTPFFLTFLNKLAMLLYGYHLNCLCATN